MSLFRNKYINTITKKFVINFYFQFNLFIIKYEKGNSLTCDWIHARIHETPLIIVCDHWLSFVVVEYRLWSLTTVSDRWVPSLPLIIVRDLWLPSLIVWLKNVNHCGLLTFHQMLIIVHSMVKLSSLLMFF